MSNGVDADMAPGPYIPVGEQLSFQYEVSSDETLYRFTEISVSDDTGVTVTCESSTFEPGDDPINCTAEEVAELGQQSYSGHVTAKAVLIAYDEALGFVGDSDSSHYFGYTLGLDLIKMTNGQIVEAPPGPALAIGKTVTWTYQLTNSSNVSLSNIAVIDNQEPVINCPLSNMAPAAIMICSATGTVEEGPYTNTAQAAGEFVEKAETILSSQVSSHYLGVPGFDLFLPFIMR